MEFKLNVIIFVFLTVLIPNLDCQFGSALNTPPILTLSTNWVIPDTEPIGSIIAHVNANDNENDELEFGLERLNLGKYNGQTSDEELPFYIDHQGNVRLNESLAGRAGENLLVYVTVSDGDLTAKNEVFVNIISANSTNPYRSRPNYSPNTEHIRKIFQGIPGINNNRAIFPQNNNRPPPPPPLQLNNDRPQKFTYVEKPEFSVTEEPNRNNNNQNTSPKPEISKMFTITPQKISPVSTEAPTLTISTSTMPIITLTTSSSVITNVIEANQVKTVLPIVIVVCGIFVTAILIALVIYRKRFCSISKFLHRKSKEEMTKKSTLNTISGNLTEDSQNSFDMHQWHGPIAYNNRYVPGWERDNNPHMMTSQLTNNNSTNIQTLLKSNAWDFPRHRLKFFNILGEGAFGQVWRCEAINIDGIEGIYTVAVKTLKENAVEAEKNDLLSELQVMKRLEPHVNVVRLLGCCVEKEPIFVILEYVNKGKLQSYLRASRAERHYGNMHGKSKTLTSADLTSFMYQVARGMDFLTSRGIIHRDLAARNILITDEHICKVADFGFARDVITSKIYERKSEGRLPIRWMAIESLYDNLFSVKSDIWSFGILMWEIVTLGSTPYPGMSASEVMKNVREGFRLEKPEHCRRELYNIMYYCWAELPEDRPDFPEVVKLLEKLLSTVTDYIELERFPDHNYYNMMGQSGEKL